MNDAVTDDAGESAGQVEPRTFSQAWRRSPGPRTTQEAGLLALKGFCMGTADIVPGVSGGTVAFVTGIYEDLLAAIASFDLEAIRRLLRLDLKGLLTHLHLRFLLPLLTGIGLALVGMARIMHYLMDEHPVQTWAAFFGLILASIVFVGREIKHWRVALLPLIAGALGAYRLVGLIPVDTPETLPYVFFCGVIAICAMILPGISGSFLLLILGKYRYITDKLRELWVLENLLVLAVFGLGAVIGIVLFSRVLRYCLRKYHDATLAVLTGFMAGALRKVWPWQEKVNVVFIHGKEKVLETRNVLPEQLDAPVALAVALMILGFVLVFVIEHVATRRRQTTPAEIAGEGGDA